MKILAIRGKNLASLEGEFVVDFMAEPLRSAGIYAITGPTGSGKSTLLDALCLALFDETPRTKLASGKAIMTDVGDKRISQSDSRNILRRGTSEGYAEVDFVSLGGERFRSTWSVRRARNKVGGSLQNVSFRVMNLTTSTEVQGGKTELLTKVSELIGLTFYQFTRAVLLAQGDFATFLKAKQNEKAELLEKLTGTEIYSEISKGINGHAKEAEAELNLLKERMKDVELLPEEVLKEKMEEKKVLLAEMEQLKNVITALTAKIKWLVEDGSLTEGVEKTKAQLAEAQQAIVAAKARYDYLAQIDTVQDVRACYTELKNAEKQWAEHRKNGEHQELERKRYKGLLASASEKVVACELEQKKHLEATAEVLPLLKRARELDVCLVGASKNVTEAKKDFEGCVKEREKIAGDIQKIKREILSSQKKRDTMAAWLEERAAFKTVIPRVDLIVSLLDDAQTAKVQGDSNAKTLAASEMVLADDAKKLLVLKAEAERLNALLPAEIAVLRAKLVENVPCPVCGSVHHVIQGDVGESLEEAELNKAKLLNKEATERLTVSVERRGAEHIRLQAAIKNYVAQQESALTKLSAFLKEVPEWRAHFERGVLQKGLTDIAALWNRNTTEMATANEQITTLQALLVLQQEKEVELGLSFALKEQKVKGLQLELEKLTAERAVLFSGRSADAVEKEFTVKAQGLTERLSALAHQKEGYASRVEHIKGVLTQLTASISKLEGRIVVLKAEVSAWIADKKGAMSAELLEELLARDSRWIETERGALNRLQEFKTSALATLKERQVALERHRQLEDRPTEEESKEVLERARTETQGFGEAKSKRLTEIEAALVNHNRGVERLKGFKKELETKGTLAENWMKLDDLLGSASGAKFKVLAQGYTLDALLTYANKHLKELSKRYELQRVPETLALQVVDLDMLGEVRTVHSLSGGESFLISLALALGLSSLSSNRMKVESLFIDEGFGSLDMDTLRVAMDALETLQTQGRKIGVISHVAEMTERVSTQIKVVKLVNGKSKIVIV